MTFAPPRDWVINANQCERSELDRVETGGGGASVDGDNCVDGWECIGGRETPGRLGAEAPGLVVEAVTCFVAFSGFAVSVPDAIGEVHLEVIGNSADDTTAFEVPATTSALTTVLVDQDSLATGMTREVEDKLDGAVECLFEVVGLEEGIRVHRGLDDKHVSLLA